MQLRAATGTDLELLYDMLLEAFNWDGTARFTRDEVVADIHTARYLGGWRRPGDFGLVEEYTPGLGLTATGVGTVTEQGAQFGFQAFNGSTGFADFSLQGLVVLVGTVTNTTLRTTTSVVLTRVG